MVSQHMKTSGTVFLSLLLLFGAATSAHTQGIEWEILNDEVVSLYQKGTVASEKRLDNVWLRGG